MPNTIKHWAVFINNASHKNKLLHAVLSDTPPPLFKALAHKKGALVSKLAVAQFMDLEDRLEQKVVTKNTQQALKTMSSGEQKKALIKHILANKPDYLVLDNPFDNLDVGSQADLKNTLTKLKNTLSIVLIISRKTDLLPFITNLHQLEESLLTPYISSTQELPNAKFSGVIPEPITPTSYNNETLIQLKDVSVNYLEKSIVNNINWTIKKGDFWELRGTNGSGKTTILSMITGENPKGYGQNLTLFGYKKGSGESIWDIKKHIGYFTPAMTDKFTGYHSIEHMLISGFTDSIGLYTKPTEAQLRVVKQWMLLINVYQIKDKLFHDLSMGLKRLIMCVRAMIKHPALLILDEPTAGLDDDSAALFVHLVNKFSKESDTAIIFVSHRQEPHLLPDAVFKLTAATSGSVGSIL